MSERKVDSVKLAALLREGKNQKQCADYFGCSETAISRARKQLNVNVVKNIALENAGRIVSKELDAAEQLSKINNHANELLDLLMRWSRGDEKAHKDLEATMKSRKIRFADPRELTIRVMGEIRNQLKLQLEIFTALYDMKAVQEFQQEVLTAIGEASPEIRGKIIGRLNEKSALRRTISLS